MLVKNIPFETIPHAEFTDSVYRVLSLMQDNEVSHIAVEHEDKFAGLLSEDELLGVDEELLVGELQHLLHLLSVKDEEHFLNAVALVTAHNLSTLPVTDAAGNLAGTIRASNLLKYIADFMRLQEPGAMVVVETDPQHYSFSEISKIIESNDAHVTQLNTSRDAEKGTMLVTIKIDKLEISDIVASFQRYEYNVKYYSGEELYINELKSNYENLMNYLNI